jgi:serine/threonine-protein kinase
MIESVSQQIGRYDLVALLGEGGMARAYLAVSRGPAGFNKVAVVKQILPSLASDADFVAMFLDEARLAARLHHRNIVQTYDVAEYDGSYVLVMEYLEGQSLASIFKRIHPNAISLETHLWLLTQILAGLHYAHTLCDYDGSPLGVVHRDVSPGNVLVTYAGEVKLLDFGVAKARCALARSTDRAVKGKVGYCAPEQLRLDDADARADVFAVGVMLWEVLAGQRLKRGSAPIESARARLTGAEPRIRDVRPGIDPELADICDRAMSHNPADRFATAAEFQTALQTQLDKLGTRGRLTLIERMGETFAADRRELRRLIDKRLASDSSAQLEERLYRTGDLTAALKPVSLSVTQPVPRDPRPRRWLIPAATGALIVLAGMTSVLWPRGQVSPPAVPTAPAPTTPRVTPLPSPPSEQPAIEPTSPAAALPETQPSEVRADGNNEAESRHRSRRGRPRRGQAAESVARADAAESSESTAPNSSPRGKKRRTLADDTQDAIVPGMQIARPAARPAQRQIDEKDPYSP